MPVPNLTGRVLRRLERPADRGAPHRKEEAGKDEDWGEGKTNYSHLDDVGWVLVK